MKRSEMVKVMKDHIEEFITYDLDISEEATEDLLGHMERLGMLPPAIFKQTTDEMSGYVMKTNDGEYVAAVRLNEWEPE